MSKPMSQLPPAKRSAPVRTTLCVLSLVLSSSGAYAQPRDADAEAAAVNLLR